MLDIHAVCYRAQDTSVKALAKVTKTYILEKKLRQSETLRKRSTSGTARRGM
jgi:hypothetical protein